MDVQTAEDKKFSSLHMAELHGHIPATEHPHFILFDISAFGSECLSMNGMSQIVIVLLGLLLICVSEALSTDILKDSSNGVFKVAV